MTPKINDITPAEWDLMRIVWTKGDVHSRDLITLLQQKRDWSESTIKTLLGRLVKKGLLQVAKSGHRFTYSATVDERVAMDETVQELFAHLCAMKKGQTLVNLVQTTTMTQADLQALQQVVQQKLVDAPNMVTCDCLPAGNGDGCAN
ncbi:CopY/TcrY family copper transport repressor [Lacticaseibacillus sp. N501-2]|uniref:CopY/TcrY family copper transport repressor n=1 Tax=Lacticaseibacillus salsurae TaxID=3367729 RepID=UPI0038B3BFC9